MLEEGKAGGRQRSTEKAGAGRLQIGRRSANVEGREGGGSLPKFEEREINNRRKESKKAAEASHFWRCLRNRAVQISSGARLHPDSNVRPEIRQPSPKSP